MELQQARAAGTAPPAMDVSSGKMINPHNPEFITKKPWYLTEGGDGGPTLDHQADQRREEEKRVISMSEADQLVREERERTRRKLERQRKKKRRRGGKGDEDEDLFEVGMWIEALKKNRKPYLIAQIVRVSDKGRSFDLKYEDGQVEKNVRPGDRSKNSFLSVPRMRVTRTGARTNVANLAFGKETYDSKRDSYHGVEVDGHMRKMEAKFKEREAMRKQQRQQQREEQEREEDERREAKAAGGGDDKDGENDDNEGASDSDSDYDSDNDGKGGEDGFSSDDEVVQQDADDKMFTTRLARQGGVGGAQMEVTARNLRIREDTAKYLRNLDPNSAYYDPKSRSMRDNPYANNADDGGDLAQQVAAAENIGFAGDNFSRISGDAVGLAETQLFAWDAEKKLGVEGAVHVQADPSRAELMRKKVETKGKEMKDRKRRAVLDRYGGEEYLDGGGGAGAAGGDNPTKETPEERATRFGVSHAEQEYGRDGRPAPAGGGTGKQARKRAPIPCKYEEDVCPNGHTAVWGSYFHKGAFKWGYEDDHSLIRSSYGTGANGRVANDESNELQYGCGRAGSAMLASARKMLEVIPKGNGNSSSLASVQPGQQSKLYGEADQHREYDDEKLKEAMRRQERQEAEAAAASGGGTKGGKRKYNSLAADVDVTEEDMEAYRMRKVKADDPMARLGDEELLDYK